MLDVVSWPAVDDARATPASPRAAPGDDDDGAFLTCVDRIAAAMACRLRPQRVVLVRVLRWFDHRWLRPPGHKVTPPPFTAARIASECHWARRADGAYEVAAGAACLHRPRRRGRDDDDARRLLDAPDAGLFVWYSSGSATDRKGSVITYAVTGRATVPWFAALVPAPHRWRASIVKGLALDDVAELLTHPLPVVA